MISEGKWFLLFALIWGTLDYFKWLTDIKKGSEKLQLTKPITSYSIVHRMSELEEGLAPVSF